MPSLSDHEVAALADHEAVALGLPRQIEAWVTLTINGRIDTEAFTAELTVEPMQYAHPFANYRRDGAILQAGERSFRLTPQQLAVFVAYDRMRAAGTSVQARLQAWPGLIAAVHSTSGGRVRLEGNLPRVLLQTVRELPAGSVTRVGQRLQPIAAHPQAHWAMLPGHRYYLKSLEHGAR